MRLPAMTGREVRAVLTKAGFRQVGQRGSHVKMRRGDVVVTVPCHANQALYRPVMMAIFKDARSTVEDVQRLLH